MSGKQRILVVDDDREILLGLRLRLESVGYEVLTASNGLEGLETAIASMPDLIVLDIRMPIMDGLAMVSALRDRDVTCTIPAIFLSANLVETVRKRISELDDCYFMEKPYGSEDLIQMVRSAIGLEKPVAAMSPPDWELITT